MRSPYHARPGPPQSDGEHMGDDGLSQQETERIAAMVEQVKERIPEFSHLLRDLVNAGLSRGWRDLVYVGDPLGPQPGEVCVSQMMLQDPGEGGSVEVEEGVRPRDPYSLARYK